MTEMDREDEAALIAALRCGDATAFDRVYDIYRPRLFAFLLRLSRSRSVAEDLLDETWLRLVSHAELLHPDTRLAAWLFTVARNLYWTHRRAARLHEAVAGVSMLWPAAESWPSPFDLTAAGELERRIERALAALPPQHREVLLLVGYEGLTPSEAATVCKVTPEALRQRLARARAALAEALGLSPALLALRRSYGT